MPDAMTVEYEITPDDLIAFNLYHHCHSPAARRQYLRSWFVPALVWLLVCTGIWYFADRDRGTPLRTFIELLPLFGGVPLYLVCFPWAYRRRVRKIVAAMVGEGENRGLLCRHRVAISPDGIGDSCEFGQTSRAWRAVERVARNGDYAFVYTSALAAIIIPRRAFATPAEFENFVRTASDYRGTLKV
jgi:hypothetical protein